jgi:hypothetical protein
VPDLGTQDLDRGVEAIVALGPRLIGALCHSAWLGGVEAIVALGVCLLPKFGVVDLCSW